MIIDTHVHIGEMLGFSLTEEDVLYSMQRYKIDFSLVSNIESAEFDHEGNTIPEEYQVSQIESNKKVLEFARINPEKIGALIWAKTFSEYPDKDLISLIEENREYIYGLKIHPFHSKVAPDDVKMEQWYKLCEKYDLPVVSHTGGCEEALSIHMYNAAKKHPNISFVMVHMDLGSDNKDAVALLGKLPNLYGDTTWVSTQSTLSAVKKWGSEKMLFGSDNPIDGKDTYLHNRTGDRSLYQQYFNEFKAVLADDDYENIMYKNAKRIFKISDSVIAKTE